MAQGTEAPRSFWQPALFGGEFATGEAVAQLCSYMQSLKIKEVASAAEARMAELEQLLRTGLVRDETVQRQLGAMLEKLQQHHDELVYKWAAKLIDDFFVTDEQPTPPKVCQNLILIPKCSDGREPVHLHPGLVLGRSKYGIEDPRVSSSATRVVEVSNNGATLAVIGRSSNSTTAQPGADTTTNIHFHGVIITFGSSPSRSHL